MEIIDKLEKPGLVVDKEWQEPSEHFGQIEYKTYAHTELEYNEIKEIVISDQDSFSIVDQLNDSAIIHTESFKYSTEVQPVIITLYFSVYTGKIEIQYYWEKI